MHKFVIAEINRRVFVKNTLRYKVEDEARAILKEKEEQFAKKLAALTSELFEKEQHFNGKVANLTS